MAHTKEYKEFVLDDLKKYSSLMRPQKSGICERILVKKSKTLRLHPNPDDEFSMPDIGPNYDIVMGYLDKYIPKYPYARQLSEENKIDPLIVEKIKPDGYMILNGHHRWLAACMIKRKTMPVKIVNISHEGDIVKAMNRTKNNICVSFDLDEVIIAPVDCKNTEPKKALSVLNKEKIREGVPALIGALSDIGCDIWIYTGQYLSEKYIRTFLGRYGINADGIVNGIKNGKSRSGITERFKERYDVSVHIDTSGVICVDTKNKAYTTAELSGNASTWASEAVGIIRESDIVKNALETAKA